LVVEGEPFVRSCSITSVEILGYPVVAAIDGNDALQKLRTDVSADILFTEIVMPGGINGWELVVVTKPYRTASTCLNYYRYLSRKLAVASTTEVEKL
jgi:CheY-like chemotaxis protein